ncbi:MAG: uracil-DNA glycosylase [Desulfurococcaceae archaeon]|nr:uracil-DNA glycosylase [Desulfurococcaceae archaeon]MCC6060771.1 uracil-DNA glycosylase [Desulfurococcaceae archaeon]
MGSKEDYEGLVSEILSCTRCPLYSSRTRAVPGEGPLNASIMFVGEAPGRSEDLEGRPFVGSAGKLLDSLLSSIGVERGGVYITNVVKCRPPGNREPFDSEVRACNPYLRRQISMIKPKIIVALGRIAGRTLYEMAGLRWDSIRAARGRVERVRVEGVDLMLTVTFHPAAALYNPGLREELENDFKNVIAPLVRGFKTVRKTTLEEFFK